MNEKSTDSEPLLEEIRWRDEVLQVMYWMHGEGFGSEITIEEIRRFLDADASILNAALQQLIGLGCIKAAAGEKFRLTLAGLHEGKRRFLDEFEPFLKQGHGECNDPDCECHQAERPEDTCIAKKEHSHS